MRKLKRWWRRFRGEWLIAPRRREVAEALRLHFRLQAKPRLTLRGSRGNDSTYLVTSGKTTLGILRLINPYSSRGGPSTPMPFQLENGAVRIEREWNAYLKGARAGLTPKPLWRDTDALLCEYIPCGRLQDAMIRAPDKAWEMVVRAARALQALHQTGITHMDVSPANILNDTALNRLIFIDFEYTPIAAVPPPAQRVYDHLLLLESAWKFIPEGKRAEYRDWLDFFSSCVDADMRRADMSPLKPALDRILNAEGLGAELRKIFASA